MAGHLFRFLFCLGVMCFGANMAAEAQSTVPPGPALTEPQLDSLVAPVALYPDVLLAQVTQASMDPSAVVAAGDLLTNSSGKAPQASPEWPGAVKALLHVPSALQLMDQGLPWTTRLGNAVKRSPEDVQAAVQRVRVKVLDAGNLVSDAKINVARNEDVVQIELADPAVLYVPQYDPAQMFEKHGAGSDAWFSYGPPISIPGYKNVADGLASVEYVHSAPQYHHHYYEHQSERETQTREVRRGGRRLPWRGWQLNPLDHYHHESRHYH